MVDEARELLDLPKLPDKLGEVILDSVWFQNKSMAEMNAQQAQQQEAGGQENEQQSEENQEFTEGEDDVQSEPDQLADEVMKSLEKAKKIRKKFNFVRII